MRYYLGIDGGGTKTQFLLADETGHLVGSERLGGVDFTQVGAAGVRAVLEAGLTAVLQQSGISQTSLAAVCAGIPCLGEYAAWDEDCPRLLTAVFSGMPTRCLNDSVVALFGSLALKPGIHLVAGTGSIASGRDQTGNTARSGGWNEHFSDEGSCYWLGLRACSLFARQADNRLPRGPLYELVRRHFGLARDLDLIAYFRDHLLGSRERIAALQVLLEKAAGQGDRSARQAYADAAAELALLAAAVRSQLSFPAADQIPVSCTGGLFRAGALIFDPLRSLLDPELYDLVDPILPPAAGALLGAYELAGEPVHAITLKIEIIKAEVSRYDHH